MPLAVIVLFPGVSQEVYRLGARKWQLAGRLLAYTPFFDGLLDLPGARMPKEMHLFSFLKLAKEYERLREELGLGEFLKRYLAERGYELM